MSGPGARDNGADTVPEILTPRKEAIPAEMRSEPRWIVWRLEWKAPKNGKPGRWDKVPYNVATRRCASSTNPATWTDFESAWNAYQSSLISGRRPYSGIGFVLGDGWTGIDLDGCSSRDDGGMDQWADDVLERIHGYVELSVSGTGVHVICHGSVPPGRRERDDPKADHTGIAVYPDGRYFTISGHVLPESAPIADQTAELAALHAWLFSANGNPGQQQIHTPDDCLDRALKSDAKLHSLWHGDITGYPSPSEADMALCVKLIYWFGRDPARIDQLFRQAGLMRDKWNREDYRQGTLRKALEWQSGTYQENGGTTEVLNQAEAYIRRYAVLPTPAYLPAALWAIATHAVEQFDCYPYLAILSAAKRSGKTRLAEVLETLVRRPWRGTAPSPAALYRMLEGAPTLLLDEVEMFNGRNKSETTMNLLAVLNAGHRKGATIPRCEPPRQDVRLFAVYGPKLFAAIGRLPDTLVDRSILIPSKHPMANPPEINNLIF